MNCLAFNNFLCKPVLKQGNNFNFVKKNGQTPNISL